MSQPPGNRAGEGGPIGSPSRPNRTISVVIIDSNPVIRDIVRLACEATHHIEVMAEAAEGEDSIELCRRLTPDVLVLGVPDIKAFQALERLDEASLRPRTIAVIGTDEGDPVYRSRVLGVEAVLEQSKLAQEIATTIELVHGGRFIYTEEHDRKTLKRLASAVHRARIKHRALSTLTPRELEILRFLAEGLSNRECANRLGISERTVESHIGKIYRKLETRSRMEAVTKAMALGLLGDEMS